MDHDKFFATFGPACVAAMLRHGSFASVRMAQIILESDWASSTPKDIDTGKESFNLTGVKGSDGPNGHVTAWSPEEENGVWVQRKSMFRAYHSFEEHICERDKIFSNWTENYCAYLAAKSPEEAIHALAHAPQPYATDSQYEAKLLALLASNDLKRFDSWPFVDVDGSAWYAADVAAMKACGIVRGDENGRLNASPDLIRMIVWMRRLHDRR
jgi:flagellum-specific peptidoglycan hydrolase FlgJ